MSERSRTPRARSQLVGLGAGLVIGALVAGGLLWSQLRTGDAVEQAYLQTHPAQRTARRNVGQHIYQTQGRKILADLRRRDEAALQEALAPVDRYFARAGRGTKRFSEAVLSWDAQWSLVTAKAATLLEKLDRLPSWLQWRWLNSKARILAAVLDRKGFHKYVGAQLKRHVLSSAGVERVVKRAALRYHRRLAANDAKLRDAMGTPPWAAPAGAASPAAEAPRSLETLYQNTAQGALHRSRSGANSKLLGNLIQRVGSKLVVALAAYALKVGAVELGLLSATTASALWSFGVGLAVAALANMALRYFLNRMGKSPGQTIGRRLAAEVASMHRCVVEGCRRKVGGNAVHIPGLRAWLQRHRTQRAQRRTQLLRRALGAV